MHAPGNISVMLPGGTSIVVMNYTGNQYSMDIVEMPNGASVCVCVCVSKLCVSE